MAGWIYGRGTADMKGSIASLLMALQALRQTGTKPRLNIEVSFTADEETDSSLGTGWLVDHAPLHADYAVVMEGGELNTVCCGHNGVVWLEVTVHGRAAHGSKPEAGINALEKMSALVLGLDGYKRALARRSFRTPEGKIMHPTINLGGVFSAGEGGKINTVPALATFSIDRRVLAVENHATAERELRAALAAAARRIPHCRITVKKVSENFACFFRPTHPFFAAMASSVTRVRARAGAVQRFDRFQRHAFFRAGPENPDARLWPWRPERARGGRECEGEGIAEFRKDLRRPADDDLRRLILDHGLAGLSLHAAHG